MLKEIYLYISINNKSVIPEIKVEVLNSGNNNLFFQNYCI